MIRRSLNLQVALLLFSVSCFLGDGRVAAQCNPGNGTGGTGADVIVGEITGGNPSSGPEAYGTAGGYYAYSIGTNSCNIGNATLLWIANNSNHPVIAQNLYRLKDGSFQQIGMSWLKHGFTALQGSTCESISGGGGPTNCNCSPSGTGSQLGIGCSDPYGAGLNGNNNSLGARSEVDEAAEGGFIYPRVLNPANQDTTWRRLRVHGSDLAPASNPGATYYVEAQYVTPDDAAAGNAYNNCSYREVTVTNNPSNYPLTFASPTHRQLPAIMAWQAADPEVVLVDVFTGELPNPGRLIVGYRVYDNGNGTWDYEYAVYNQNSTRSVASFNLPLPAGASVTLPSFHDAEYHSGEVFSGADWTASVAPGSISWATTPFASNSNANAIRWGSLYNFRFRSTSAPSICPNNTLTLGLFTPGTPSSVTVPVVGPDGSAVAPVSGLTCSPASPGALLTWNNGQSYTGIEVVRDGVLLQTIAGSMTSFSDTAAPFGPHSYSVTGITASGTACAADCGVMLEPDPVTNLSCTANFQEVTLSWTNGAGYDLIRVYRGPSLVANLLATDTSYVDSMAPLGSQQYRVEATGNGIVSAPALCNVQVNPLPGLLFEYECESRSASYDLTTGTGSFTVAVGAREMAANPGFPNQTGGFSLALANDPSYLSPTGITLSSTFASLNGGAGPGFYAPSVTADGITAGIIYTLSPPAQTMAFGADVDLMTVTYETNASTLAGAGAGAVTQLQFLDSVLGVPPVDNIVAVGQDGLTPVTIDGAITLDPTTGGIFRRGDCNADGGIDIADAVFVLGYLFPSAQPVVMSCADACEGNDDGNVDIADAVAILSALFGNPTGIPLPAPYPNCGADPTTGDMLDCATYNHCP